MLSALFTREDTAGRFVRAAAIAAPVVILVTVLAFLAPGALAC
jgi:type III secretory pathway component EscV